MQRYIDRLAAAMVLLAVLFSFIAAYAVSPADYNVAEPENLVAEHLFCESALLVDADTGEILFTNNSRVRMFPASTTKIATLYVGIKGGIDLDEVVTIPDEAADIASGSSVIPVKPGDKLTYRDLLYSFMMTSGNDGANAIAVLTSGSISAFVEKMNAWVAEIGCVGTHFTNAHGLHNEDHYTTAQDLALMTRVAMEDETFRDIVACAEYDMTISRKGETVNRTVVTRNTLLIKDQKYYYADCIGVKTGHTGKAGYCFVGAAERDGMNVISVVLNCPEDHHKWYDSAKLFEYGFTQYEDVSVYELFRGAGSGIASVYVNGASETDAGGGYLDLELMLDVDHVPTEKVVKNNEVSRNFAMESFRTGAKVVLPESIEAPVSEMQEIGTLEYTTRTGDYVSARLVASRSVERQPDPTPEPIISFGGGAGGIIVTILVIFAVVLVLLIIICAVAAARQKKKRRMMEMRRREQLRRQRMRAANGGRQASARPSGRDPRYDSRNRRRY